MINFQALQGTLGVNVGPWRQGFASAEGVARGFVSRTSALFRGLFSAASGLMSIGTRIAKDMAIVGAAVASVGVIAAATSSKITASFEQSMARVDALTGASTRSAEEFQRLEDAAKKMGAETVFSARQASEAMQFFALAGFQTEEIIGALPHSLNLAAAGQIDIAEAADITSKVMKSMGLNVEDLASSTDVLTKAMTTANTDLTQLGEAFKQQG